MPEPMILEVLTGKDKGLQITIPASGAVVGSDWDCDIQLDERTLSGKHCRIVREKTKWVIQDLRSRRGVIVNDAKVRKRSLGQGDVVRLGNLPLRVTAAPVESIPQPTGEKRIRFKCKCGKQYVVKETFAGKTTTCKHCGASFLIPLHTVEHAGNVPEVQRKTKVLILAGIAIAVLMLVRLGLYVYHDIRKGKAEAAHRHNIVPQTLTK